MRYKVSGFVSGDKGFSDSGAALTQFNADVVSGEGWDPTSLFGLFDRMSTEDIEKTFRQRAFIGNIPVLEAILIYVDHYPDRGIDLLAEKNGLTALHWTIASHLVPPKAKIILTGILFDAAKCNRERCHAILNTPISMSIVKAQFQPYIGSTLSDSFKDSPFLADFSEILRTGFPPSRTLSYNPELTRPLGDPELLKILRKDHSGSQSVTLLGPGSHQGCSFGFHEVTSCFDNLESVHVIDPCSAVIRSIQTPDFNRLNSSYSSCGVDADVIKPFLCPEKFQKILTNTTFFSGTLTHLEKTSQTPPKSPVVVAVRSFKFDFFYRVGMIAFAPEALMTIDITAEISTHLHRLRSLVTEDGVVYLESMFIKTLSTLLLNRYSKDPESTFWDLKDIFENSGFSIKLVEENYLKLNAIPIPPNSCLGS